MSCKYCQQIKDSSQKELRVLYQESLYAKLFIGKALNRPALLVEKQGCPKYAECSQRDHHRMSAFYIKYCPHCGAKMDEEEEEGS